MTETYPERPFHPISTDGGPNEIRDLIQARAVRRLRPAEEARLAALTFEIDPALERDRLLSTGYPDVWSVVPRDSGLILDAYEARRANALAGGRVLADPDPAVVAAIERVATEYRQTLGDPFHSLDAEHRERFRAAVGLGDFSLVVKEWTAWLAAGAERDVFARRRAAAAQAIGRPTVADVRRPPSFIPELEAAVGGGTIAQTMPIIQR